MSKKLMSIFLVIILCFTTTISAFAEKDKGPWTIKYDENKNVYLHNIQTGQDMWQAITLDESGNPVYLDLKDYLQELNNQAQQDIINLKVLESMKSEKTQESLTVAPDSIVAPQVIGTQRVFRESYSFNRTEGYIKVSPSVVGPATITYGNAVTITDSFQTSINLTTEAIRKLIKVGASFTWNDSLSTSSSFSTSFSVPSGRTGYVGFAARTNGSYGRVYDQVFDGTNVYESLVGTATGYSPQKLSSGFCDGTYALITE